jgi:hypothetical protein
VPSLHKEHPHGVVGCVVLVSFVDERTTGGASGSGWWKLGCGGGAGHRGERLAVLGPDDR